jgi:prepilin-type N-terminal cleavage/methylation domain-containing protein
MAIAEIERRTGFTLIELIVVIVLIGILASIAGPMAASNVQKAKLAEAVTAMGAIRIAERLYYVEHGTYVSIGALDWYSTDLPPIVNVNNPLYAYLTVKDLSGRYFGALSYSVQTSDTGYDIYARLHILNEGGCESVGNLVMNERGYVQSFNSIP